MRSRYRLLALIAIAALIVSSAVSARERPGGGQSYSSGSSGGEDSDSGSYSNDNSDDGGAALVLVFELIA